MDIKCTEAIQTGEYEKNILTLLSRAEDMLRGIGCRISDESVYTIIKEWYNMYKELYSMSKKYNELLEIEQVHKSLNGSMQEEITQLREQLQQEQQKYTDLDDNFTVTLMGKHTLENELDKEKEHNEEYHQELMKALDSRAKLVDKIKAKINELDNRDLTVYIGEDIHKETFQQVLREQLKLELQELIQEE